MLPGRRLRLRSRRGSEGGLKALETAGKVGVRRFDSPYSLISFLFPSLSAAADFISEVGHYGEWVKNSRGAEVGCFSLLSLASSTSFSSSSLLILPCHIDLTCRVEAGRGVPEVLEENEAAFFPSSFPVSFITYCVSLWVLWG